MQTKYTYKQIWLIAYPILISLLMEQMIGMTDTAFLGRVGEVELGASAIAGVFYRSEERRVGKECLRLCRSRWSPYH